MTVESTLQTVDVTAVHPDIGCRQDGRVWRLRLWAYRGLLDVRVGQCLDCGAEPQITSPLPWQRR